MTLVQLENAFYGLPSESIARGEWAAFGYEPYSAALTHSVSGWVWGNVFFGGLIGLAVDAGTSNLHNIEPEHIQANLTKAK